FLRGGTAPDRSQHPAASLGRRLRLRAAGRFAEIRVRAHLFVQPDLVHDVGVPFLAECAEPGGEALLQLASGDVCAGVRRDCGAALGRCPDEPAYTGNGRPYAGVFAGDSTGGTDLSSVAAQLPADRSAEESRICGVGDVSGTAVLE